MFGKVKVGYMIPTGAQAQLRALAERDQRSLSGEVAWLIGQEWRRYMLALDPHWAQREQREQRAQPEQRAKRMRRADRIEPVCRGRRASQAGRQRRQGPDGDI